MSSKLRVESEVHGAVRFNAPGRFIGLDFAADSGALLALVPGQADTEVLRFAVPGGEVVERRTLSGAWSQLRVLDDGDLALWAPGAIARVSPDGAVRWTVKSPEAARVVVAGDAPRLVVVTDQRAELRDLSTGKKLRGLELGDGDVNAAAVGPAAAWLVLGSTKGAIRVLDTATGAVRAQRKATMVTALAVSRDGAVVASGHGQGAVSLWHADTLKPLRGVAHHKFSAGGAGCRWIGFGPDGVSGYSLGNERAIRAWTVDGGEHGVVEVDDRHPQGALTALSPDGRWIATGSTDGALSVWSVGGLAPLVTDAVPGDLEAIALTSRGVAVAGRGRNAAWSRGARAAHESCPTTFPPAGIQALSNGAWARLDYASIFVGKQLSDEASSFELDTYASGALAAAPTGGLLAAPAQNQVEIWDAVRGVRLASLPHEAATRAAAFGPGNRWVVTADRALRIWRLGDREAEPAVIRTIRFPDDTDAGRYEVHGLAVSARGWIAAVIDSDVNHRYSDSAVVVFDPRDGALVARLAMPGVRLGQVAFAGGARLVVVDSSRGLWSTDVHAPRWHAVAPGVAEPPHWLVAQPVAVCGDEVAYLAPHGNIAVVRLPAIEKEPGAPFTLTEPAPRRTSAPSAPISSFERRLAGCRFWFTGRFEDLPLATRALVVEELGGTIAATLDAKVTHVVKGRDAKPPPREGVTVLDEAGLRRLLVPTAAEGLALLRGDVPRAAARWNAWRKRYQSKWDAFPINVLGVDLAGRDLRGYELRGLDLSNAALASARLAKVDLYDSKLRDADLRDVDFTRGGGYHVAFSRARLRGAKLVKARMVGAKLDGADLRDADLTGCELRGADLRGADLRGATLTRAELEDIKHDAKTRWPRGTKPA